MNERKFLVADEIVDDAAGAAVDVEAEVVVGADLRSSFSCVFLLLLSLVVSVEVGQE